MTEYTLNRFLSKLGLDEEPMGLFFTNEKPEEGFSPTETELPTREKELEDKINWPVVFGEFSCTIGHIWRARRKKGTAYFSNEQFGCAGAAFWMGFTKPQTETVINYIATGVPGWNDGERYCDSPETVTAIFDYVDPMPAPKKYCVVKPVSQFSDAEVPVLVIFFARPETLSGLHQLATFVTDDPEVVASPWGAACGSLVAWPLHYLEKGQNRAVIGGWDPSARKFFKTDELSFTIPYQMFQNMLDRYKDSFLDTETWETVQKKITRSNKAWSRR